MIKQVLYVITTLAMYQTRFWGEVGVALQKHGHQVAFLAFDDRSKEYLEWRGFRTFNIFTLGNALNASDPEQIHRYLARYHLLSDLNLWLSHERVAFGIRDSNRLVQKLAKYLFAVEQAFDEISWHDVKPILVQELGGFLSVIASYHVAVTKGIDNYFVEPTFFRGRLFFLRNSFKALTVPGPSLDTKASEDVKRYLETTLATCSIVIPLKDQHQYRSAVAKIVNPQNLRRLIEKSIDKYLLRKRLEFGYIGAHVSTHLRMLFNSVRLRTIYTHLSKAGPFIYYPLHVPGDMALTLRSPEYFDQLALVDFLARVVPLPYKVAIKEHPAMIGATDAYRMRQLIKRYDNLVLLPPGANNFEVLKAADLVVSVNSKSGAEALLLGKPVIVLGDAFYRSSRLVRTVTALSELSQVIHSALAQIPPAREDIESYFQGVWDASQPGELYVANGENVEVFTRALLHETSPDVVGAQVVCQAIQKSLPDR